MMNIPQEKTDSPPEAKEAQDVVTLHQLSGCRVVKYPDSTVVKTGRRVILDERWALEFAAQLNLPVPRVHEAHMGPDGEVFIRMDFVQGEILASVWPSMTAEEKDSICRQLREILTKMRSVPWETGLIGSCSGGPARDCRQYTDYSDGPYKDEATFNSSFYFDLVKTTPDPLRTALFNQLRNDHRIVFTHGDLAQQNILVEDGRVAGLLDWEYAGWYPEHWEYIKFFERPCEHRDWKDRAHMIFPQLYENEIAYHQSILRWQRP